MSTRSGVDAVAVSSPATGAYSSADNTAFGVPLVYAVVLMRTFFTTMGSVSSTRSIY